MGNCQAAEAAAVVIHHPGGRLESVCWSISASQVMVENPGHYVAVIVASSSSSMPNSNRVSAGPARHLKLLRPDETLQVGHVYHLVSFEEVLKELASKKNVKLSRLLFAPRERERGTSKPDRGRASHSESSPAAPMTPAANPGVVAEDAHRVESSSRICGGDSGGGEAPPRQRQWKPALQTIAEVGSLS